MPLFKLLPGRPSNSFSSLTAFLGGMPFFGRGVRVYVRVVVRASSMRKLGNEAEPAASRGEMKKNRSARGGDSVEMGRLGPVVVRMWWI